MGASFLLRAALSDAQYFPRRIRGMGPTLLLWAALSHAQYFPRRVPGHARRSLQGNRPPPRVSNHGRLQLESGFSRYTSRFSAE